MQSNTKLLLIVTAVLELATGIALLIAPSLVAELLLGAGLGSLESVAVARVAGAAIVSIGLTCWLQRVGGPGGPITGLVAGLLVYNVAIPVLFAHAALADGMHGVALWPVCIAHTVLAIWCVACLRYNRGEASHRTPLTV